MWLWTCYTPHPPIILPEIGRGRERDAGSTLSGMGQLRASVERNMPDILLLLSPHAPCSRGLALTLATEYGGDFSAFGVPWPRFSIAGAAEQGERLASFLFDELPGSVARRTSVALDHGSLVPLVSLLGWTRRETPALIVANPIGLTSSEALALGRRLAGYDHRATWGLVASGDLSHKVTPDAPNGYSPLGAAFDGKVTRALAGNDPQPLLEISDDEIEEVGQCGLNSVLAALGLGAGRTGRLISYEAPFGVGYATAFTPLHGGPELARASIAEALGGPPAEAALKGRPELAKRAACFVSLKKRGALRGCIGTILPRHESLAEEIEQNSVAAATQDPRFPPVGLEELSDIEISVDILSEPEAVTDLRELDPKRYGVIVERGGRRGVLLPDLEGVDSVEEQLAIAARKAGLPGPEGSAILRFTVRRIREVPLP